MRLYLQGGALALPGPHYPLAMDLSTAILTSLIVLYGFVQYSRRERWFRDAMLVTTKRRRTIVFGRTLESFRIITIAGAFVGLFLLSGLVFMMDELTRGVPTGLMALAMLLSLLLLVLPLLILRREIRSRRRRPARPVDQETGMPL